MPTEFRPLGTPAVAQLPARPLYITDQHGKPVSYARNCIASQRLLTALPIPAVSPPVPVHRQQPPPVHSQPPVPAPLRAVRPLGGIHFPQVGYRRHLASSTASGVHAAGYPGHALHCRRRRRCQRTQRPANRPPPLGQRRRHIHRGQPFYARYIRRRRSLRPRPQAVRPPRFCRQAADRERQLRQSPARPVDGSQHSCQRTAQAIGV